MFKIVRALKRFMWFSWNWHLPIVISDPAPFHTDIYHTFLQDNNYTCFRHIILASSRADASENCTRSPFDTIRQTKSVSLSLTQPWRPVKHRPTYILRMNCDGGTELPRRRQETNMPVEPACRHPTSTCLHVPSASPSIVVVGPPWWTCSPSFPLRI